MEYDGEESRRNSDNAVGELGEFDDGIYEKRLNSNLWSKPGNVPIMAAWSATLVVRSHVRIPREDYIFSGTPRLVEQGINTRPT